MIPVDRPCVWRLFCRIERCPYPLEARAQNRCKPRRSSDRSLRSPTAGIPVANEIGRPHCPGFSVAGEEILGLDFPLAAMI